MTSVVAIGDDRRKREAMDNFVSDIVKGTDEGVVSCLRIALEVPRIHIVLIFDAFKPSSIMPFMFLLAWMGRESGRKN
jgi:hypothetical protein